jgi:hypothetical protein
MYDGNSSVLSSPLNIQAIISFLEEQLGPQLVIHEWEILHATFQILLRIKDPERWYTCENPYTQE